MELEHYKTELPAENLFKSQLNLNVKIQASLILLVSFKMLKSCLLAECTTCCGKMKAGPNIMQGLYV